VRNNPRHVGKHTEQKHSFNEDRAETILRHRIAKDRAIVRNQSRQVEMPGLLAHISKPGNGNRECDEINCAGEKEHGAPSKDVTDHTCARCPEQVAAHRRKQQPTNRHLPLLHRNPITGNGQCNRENAARGGARHHA